MDVSHRALEVARERLHWDRLPPKQQERVRLIQGSLTYRDRRLAGYDAAAVVEVIEHLDEPRLAAFERVLFEFARPKTAVVTTPNVEYNVRFPTLPAGRFRHKDHRFEWTRGQFKSWVPEESAMNRLIEAIYENGVLRPVSPLQLQEGESVKLVLVSGAPEDQFPAVEWDADTARAAMKEIAALPAEGPDDGEPVAREHDRYLYGDRSKFAKDRQR